MSCEEIQMRCPRLGGEVPFSYCMREGGDLPCQRVLKCWGALLPIEEYLRQRLTPEQWERCFCRGPAEKIASLLNLVEEAKRSAT